MHIISQTPRLLIREFLPEEESLYVDLYSDKQVTQFVKEHSHEETKRRFAEGLAEYGEGKGLGRWAIFTLADNDFTGVCRLKTTDQGPRCIELGYVLNQKSWGKGIGGEMAKAIVAYAFAYTSANEIIAVTNLQNIASQKVLEKAGFKRRGNIIRDGQELAFFRIEKNIL